MPARVVGLICVSCHSFKGHHASLNPGRLRLLLGMSWFGTVITVAPQLPPAGGPSVAEFAGHRRPVSSIVAHRHSVSPAVAMDRSRPMEVWPQDKPVAVAAW